MLIVIEIKFLTFLVVFINYIYIFPFKKHHKLLI